MEKKMFAGNKYEKLWTQKAEQMFEQFSSEVLIEREDILEKCLGRSDWLNEVRFEEWDISRLLSMATVYSNCMGLLVFIFLATMYQRMVQDVSNPCLKF